MTLYLDKNEIAVLLNCLTETKNRREQKGDFSLDYESPVFEESMYLEGALKKIKALENIVKAEDDYKKAKTHYINLCNTKPTEESF